MSLLNGSSIILRLSAMRATTEAIPVTAMRAATAAIPVTALRAASQAIPATAWRAATVTCHHAVSAWGHLPHCFPGHTGAARFHPSPAVCPRPFLRVVHMPLWHLAAHKAFVRRVPCTPLHVHVCVIIIPKQQHTPHIFHTIIKGLISHAFSSHHTVNRILSYSPAHQ